MTDFDQSDLDDLRHDRDRLKKLLASKEAEIEQLKSSKSAILASTSNAHVSQLEALYSEIKDMKRHYAELQLFVEQQLEEGPLKHMQDMETGLHHLMQMVSESTSRVHLAEQRASLERRRSEWLHWELQNIKGNIRVFCRVRPFLPGDGDEKNRAVHISEGESVSVVDIDNAIRKIYYFDRVYRPSEGQHIMYEDIKELVTAACDGFSCCAFSYGQALSGKTHTMVGSLEDPGLMLRCVQTIWNRMQEFPDYHYNAKIGVVEVMNEQVFDLIAEAYERQQQGHTNKDQLRRRQFLDIRQDASGIGVDCLEVPLTDPAKVRDVIIRAAALRAQTHVGGLYWSSRSHLLMTVRIEAVDPANGKKYFGKLHLCDLAGFERPEKNSARSKFGKNINQSLVALQDVVTALHNKDPHVPFRRSKLTHLLQDSLSGNCKLLMVVCLSPRSLDLKETFGSLAFARAAKAIELGGVRREVETEFTKMLKESKTSIATRDDQIQSLSTQLDEAKAELQRVYALREGGKDLATLTKAWESERTSLMNQRAMLLKTVNALTSRVMATSKEASGVPPGEVQRSSMSTSAPSPRMPTQAKTGDRRVGPRQSKLQRQVSPTNDQPPPSAQPPAISEAGVLWKQRCMELKGIVADVRMCGAMLHDAAQRDNKVNALQLELRMQMMNVKSLVQKCSELSKGNKAASPETEGDVGLVPHTVDGGGETGAEGGGEGEGEGGVDGVEQQPTTLPDIAVAADAGAT